MNARLLGIEPATDAQREQINALLLSLPPVPPEIIPPGHIRLDSSPEDAPCCIKVVSHDGRDLLCQTDWDFPAVASVFGWSTDHPFAGKSDGEACLGSKLTDGTVKCPHCGLAAGWFIEQAREWLDENDGAIAEDPGYFHS